MKTKNKKVVVWAQPIFYTQICSCFLSLPSFFPYGLLQLHRAVNFSLYLVFILPSEEFPAAGLRCRCLNFLSFYTFLGGGVANEQTLKYWNAPKLLFLHDLPRERSLSLLPWYLWIRCRAFYCHAIISDEQEWWSSIKHQETKRLRRGRGLVAFFCEPLPRLNYFMPVSVTVTRPAVLSGRKKGKKKKTRYKKHTSGAQVTKEMTVCVFLRQSAAWRKPEYIRLFSITAYPANRPVGNWIFSQLVMGLHTGPSQNRGTQTIVFFTHTCCQSASSAWNPHKVQIENSANRCTAALPSEPSGARCY